MSYQIQTRTALALIAAYATSLFIPGCNNSKPATVDPFPYARGDTSAKVYSDSVMSDQDGRAFALENQIENWDHINSFTFQTNYDQALDDADFVRTQGRVSRTLRRPEPKHGTDSLLGEAKRLIQELREIMPGLQGIVQRGGPNGS